MQEFLSRQVSRFLLCFLCALVVQPLRAADLSVGFAEVDVTPTIGARPVYLAGFGQNRKATAVLDPIMARAMVLRHGDTKIAIASVDTVGLFLPAVQRIRARLPGFTYILAGGTHNHHGPDTMGLWGPNPFTTGVDAEYMKRVEAGMVDAVKSAEKSLRPATSRIGRIAVPELLTDTRPPIVLHDELVVLQFRDPGTEKPSGIVVQWNCHPETLNSQQTKVSADYVGTTVEILKKKFDCPVLYLTGTVGGLMTSMRVDIRSESGAVLPEGSVEKTKRYGEILAQKSLAALDTAKPLTLTPMSAKSVDVAVPVANKMFIVGKQVGIFERPMEAWTGDLYQKPGVMPKDPNETVAMRTEVGWLRLGDLDIAVIPGEIYPELVLGKVTNPADPNADFPDAPIEPAIYAALDRPYRMIVGLGNDEIGYILPKRQWDGKPPFTFGLKKAPYGEVNSVGPETGPLLCRAFKELVEGRKQK